MREHSSIHEGWKLQGPARSRPSSSEQHRVPRRSWPTAMRIISMTRFGWIASGSVGFHSRCGIRGQDHQANGLSHSARSRWNARMSYSTPRVKILLRRPTDKSRWCLPSGRRRANVWTQSASGTPWKCLWNGSGMCASGSQHPLCDEVGQASTQATCRVKRYRVPRSGVIDVADRVAHSQRRLVA